jgi:F-type H+-transporting ATPase subunit delta
MAKVDDRDLPLGRLYAEAMLRLAEERGQGDALLEELQELVALLDQDPRLDDFLASPLVDGKVRARVIEETFRGRASDVLVDSLQVINRKGRLAFLRAVAEAYRIAHRDLRGWVDVHVRTAVPLTEALRSRVRNAAAASTGKKPTLVERVDPALIGGIVIEAEGRKLNASVLTRLLEVRDALRNRASEEIIRGTPYVAES